MKKILASISFVVVMYACFAFVAMEMLPTAWSEDARLGFVLVSLFGAFLSAIATVVDFKDLPG